MNCMVFDERVAITADALHVLTHSHLPIEGRELQVSFKILLIMFNCVALTTH